MSVEIAPKYLHKFMQNYQIGGKKDSIYKTFLNENVDSITVDKLKVEKSENFFFSFNSIFLALPKNHDFQKIFFRFFFQWFIYANNKYNQTFEFIENFSFLFSQSNLKIYLKIQVKKHLCAEIKIVYKELIW